MTHAHKPRRWQHAMAARQALRLCEAELPWLTCDGPDPDPSAGTRRPQPHSGVTAKAALRAAGLPPDLAAALRSRLRPAPESKARP